MNLDPSWLARPSTEVAPDLVGCYLIRRLSEDLILRGLIVETEAYAPGDPACHGYRRRTPRNQAMFGPAGRVYVYIIYGMYHCLNIVSDADGVASAVLIRAVQLETLPPWIDPHQEPQHRVAAGPGKLCRVMQIDRSLDDHPLGRDHSLDLEPRSCEFQRQLETGAHRLIQTTRIGLTKGTDIPWRWYLADCKAVSKKG